MTYEERFCPHCGQSLQVWPGPPETGWGDVLVCCNDSCEHFTGGNEELVEQGASEHMSCRYAENPDNNYASFNLLAWCPSHVRTCVDQTR